jgi:hypothetical protein
VSDEFGRIRNAAIAFISTKVSMIYSSYSKVLHSLTDNLHLIKEMRTGPILLATHTKAWIWGASSAGVVISNPARSIDFSLLWLLCVVRHKTLGRVYHLSSGVLQNVMCLSVIVKPRRWGGLGTLGLSSHEKKNCLQEVFAII